MGVFDSASEKSVFEELANIFNLSGILSVFSGFESIKILVIFTIPVNLI